MVNYKNILLFDLIVIYVVILKDKQRSIIKEDYEN